MSNAFFEALVEDNAEECESYLKTAKKGFVNSVDEDGLTPLHKACKHGATKVIPVLLAHDADPNLENPQTLETCLHMAATCYREDTEGKMEYEDMIVELVKGGAMAFPDRGGRFPDMGEDAAGVVDKAYRDAEQRGKPLLKERLAERKARGQQAFTQAMADHISNASACAITVCDSADTEGYKYGSRS